MKSKVIVFLAIITSSVSVWANNIATTDLEIKNVKQFNEQIITGGQPTLEALAQLKAQDVKTVINLRGLNEFDGFDEGKAVDSLGMNYIALPISGAAGVTKEAAQQFANILEKAEGKVFIHCASGNRVGALMALKSHYHNNQSIEQSIETGKRAGLRSLESKVLGIIETEKTKVIEN